MRCDDLLKVAYELWLMLPNGRKKKINFIKAFRWKTGVNHEEALKYYEKAKRYYYRLDRL